MAVITLRILDGPNRGRVYESLSTPVSVGREEGNSVQLDDDRVSRFHLKLQEDHDRVVLTDLESTNGTRVNGEVTKLWVLRPGDLIFIGRTVLLVGAREEIAARLDQLRGETAGGGIALGGDEALQIDPIQIIEFDLTWLERPEDRIALHTLQPPELPKQLSPGQAAQLTELLVYLHLRLRTLVETVRAKSRDRVTLELREWQALVDLYDRMAGYLRQVGDGG